MSTSRAHRRHEGWAWALCLGVAIASSCAKRDDASSASDAVAQRANEVTVSLDDPATPADEPVEAEPEPFPGVPQSGDQSDADAVGDYGGRRIGIDGERKRDAAGQLEKEEAGAPVGGSVGGMPGASSSAKRRVSGTGTKAPSAKPSPSPNVPTEDLPEASKRSKKKNKQGPSQDPALANATHLLTKLNSLEGDLRKAGVRLPQDELAAAGSEGNTDDRAKGDLDCAQVCELAEAICDLEVRICALSKAHPEDDRYKNACERAGGDCRAGSEVCNSCD